MNLFVVLVLSQKSLKIFDKLTLNSEEVNICKHLDNNKDCQKGSL
jgi:hypothetical protein